MCDATKPGVKESGVTLEDMAGQAQKAAAAAAEVQAQVIARRLFEGGG